MKPAPFRYARPASLEQALDLLARHPEARVLAGGQSLMPLLNMRLVRPPVLVDLNAVPGLDGIAAAPGGGLVLGAMVRHAEVAASPLVRERAPLLAEAARHVGHAAIRHRGTIGGSAAHADPAAELPAALLALDARFTATGPAGSRAVAAGEFFRGLLATALGAGEILTAVEVPPQPPAWGFAEVARRPGDFALAGVAAVLAPRPGERGHCEGARVVGFGLADRPARLRAVEAALLAGPLDAAALARAAQLAPGDSDPPDDVHASAEYRGHLASVLAERVLVQALGRLGAAA